MTQYKTCQQIEDQLKVWALEDSEAVKAGEIGAILRTEIYHPFIRVLYQEVNHNAKSPEDVQRAAGQAIQLMANMLCFITDSCFLDSDPVPVINGLARAIVQEALEIEPDDDSESESENSHKTLTH